MQFPEYGRDDRRPHVLLHQPDNMDLSFVALGDFATILAVQY
jgi:hypothetical protein